MFHKRLYQFVLVYIIGLAFLFAIKGVFNLSDYVIPGLSDIYITVRRVFTRYFFDVLNTLSVAIVGHILSIALATVVGIIGRLSNWMGSLIRTAAFNIQAYPIVAVAPISLYSLGTGFPQGFLLRQ